MTGTNALMVLPYILGTLVSVGNFMTYPRPEADGEDRGIRWKETFAFKLLIPQLIYLVLHL